MERQAREAVAAADLEAQVQAIVDQATGGVTDAEVATLLHCAAASAKRALDSLADRNEIVRSGGYYERGY